MKKNRKKKKRKNSEYSCSMSSENRNISSNQKFKEEDFLKNELIKINKNKSITGVKKEKKLIPVLRLEKEKIKKKKELHSNLNNILSEKEMNKEYNENNRSFKKNKMTFFKRVPNNYDNDNEPQSIQSSKIKILQNLKEDSKIKTNAKSPMNQNIQILPPKKKRSKKKKKNFFRKDINIIEQKSNQNHNTISKSLAKQKRHIVLKPIKINKTMKNSFDKYRVKNSHTSKSNQYHNYYSKDNNNDNNAQHLIDYDRHFGNEENCPLCQMLIKKNKFMENIVCGNFYKKKKHYLKKINYGLQKNPSDNMYNLRNKIINNDKKEDDKEFTNINNCMKCNEVMPKFSIQSKTFYKDLDKLFSFKRIMSVKNLNKNEVEYPDVPENVKKNEQQKGEHFLFPAINSYFHS